MATDRDDLCRTCLKISISMISLSADHVVCNTVMPLLDLIKICTSAKINIDDEFPQYVCLDCVRSAEKAFEFRMLCEQSDETLRSSFHVQLSDTEKDTSSYPEDTFIGLVKFRNPAQIVHTQVSEKLAEKATECASRDANLALVQGVKVTIAYTCPVCNCRFSTPSALTEHDKTHKPVSYQCSKCPVRRKLTLPKKICKETNEQLIDEETKSLEQMTPETKSNDKKQNQNFDSSGNVTLALEIMSDDSDSTGIPETKKKIRPAKFELLPKKSRDVYENSYKRFVDWQREHKIFSFSEDVVISYFVELASKMKPSSLWSHYSMLKTTLNMNNSIEIGNYPKLIPFLKKQSNGYQPKKSRILTREQIDKFLIEAPDHKYLMIKVALIFGVAGALRREEMSKMKLEDIEDLGSTLLIKILDPKSNRFRFFTVLGDSYLNLYRKYIAVRPINMDEPRFFIKYQNGKCHRQVVGIHKLSATAHEVAAYLKLPEAKSYTGHCLRRTSIILKKRGGW